MYHRTCSSLEMYSIYKVIRRLGNVSLEPLADALALRHHGVVKDCIWSHIFLSTIRVTDCFTVFYSIFYLLILIQNGNVSFKLNSGGLIMHHTKKIRSLTKPDR